MFSKFLVDALIALARLNPGQPVAIISTNRGLEYGVMNILAEPDDWMFTPELFDPAESIALPLENKNPVADGVKDGEPGGTRTLNQLIKSQQRGRKPRRKGGKDAA